MKHFKASMQYNKDTSYRLAKVIGSVSSPWAKPLLYLICILSIASGFFYFSTTAAQLAVIAFGCLLLTNINAPAKRKANQSMNAVGNKDFMVNYYFEKDSFTMTSTLGQRSTLAYCKIVRLAEDKKYLYIFSNLSSAYMIEKNSIENGDFKELKTFLSCQVHKVWRKVF